MMEESAEPSLTTVLLSGSEDHDEQQQQSSSSPSSRQVVVAMPLSPCSAPTEREHSRNSEDVKEAKEAFLLPPASDLVEPEALPVVTSPVGGFSLARGSTPISPQAKERDLGGAASPAASAAKENDAAPLEMNVEMARPTSDESPAGKGREQDSHAALVEVDLEVAHPTGKRSQQELGASGLAKNHLGFGHHDSNDGPLVVPPSVQVYQDVRSATSTQDLVAGLKSAMKDELKDLKQELCAVKEEMKTERTAVQQRWELFSSEERQRWEAFQTEHKATGSKVEDFLAKATASNSKALDDDDSWEGDQVTRIASKASLGVQKRRASSMAARSADGKEGKYQADRDGKYHAVNLEDAGLGVHGVPSATDVDLDEEAGKEVSSGTDTKNSPPWIAGSIGLVVLCSINVFMLFVAKPDFHNPDHDDPHVVRPWEPYVVLNGVAISMFFMALGLPADLLLFGLSSSFCVMSIITVDELLGGLGNSGVVAVAALCIVSKAIDQTKALKGIMGSCLGKPTTNWNAMLRMAFPVVSLGTVFNNTPLVAVMIPIVKDWTKQSGLQASYFMMPLSFVTMLSACITTMGSSTNLLAVQLVPDAHIAFLDLAPVGFIVMIVGVAYCCLFAPILLPANSDMSIKEEAAEKVPEAAQLGPGLASEAGLQPTKHRYTVIFELAEYGPLLDRDADNGGLLQALSPPAAIRCLYGCEQHPHFCPGDQIAAINVTQDDIASMAAVPGLNIVALGARYRSMTHQRSERESFCNEPTRRSAFAFPVRKWVAANVAGGWASTDRQLFEVVIPPGGLARHGSRRNSILGQMSCKDLQKQLSDWSCTLIAMQGMHPQDEEMLSMCGGEILLVQALSKSFIHDTRGAFQRAFPVAEGSPPVRIIMSPLDPLRPALAVLGLAACVGFSALEIFPLVPTALLVGLGSVVLGTLNSKDLYGAINGPVLLTVAGSFGVGAAFAKTGVASRLASAVLTLVEDSGPYAVLGAVIMLALLLGVIVSNNTTVILLAPMVKTICERQNMDLKMVMLAVIYAANLSFATPFSYQTNMMVMPHGQYGFMDYVKFGVPMMLLCGATALICTLWIWG